MLLWTSRSQGPSQPPLWALLGPRLGMSRAFICLQGSSTSSNSIKLTMHIHHNRAAQVRGYRKHVYRTSQFEPDHTSQTVRQSWAA